MARNNYLQHFGILGMHWGIRRYQNSDGSLTSAGKKRYGVAGDIEEAAKKAQKDFRGANVSAKDISDRMKGRLEEEIDEEMVDSINNYGQSVVRLSEQLHEVAAQEAKAAMKSEEFKKELQKKLYSDFGNGCDDDELFELTRDFEFREMMLGNEKYSQKTQKKLKEFTKAANEYFTQCEKISDTIIDKIGDQKVASLKKQNINYRDVINQKLFDDTGSAAIAHLVVNTPDSVFMLNSKIGDYPYSMSDYNRDAKSIGKY